MNDLSERENLVTQLLNSMDSLSEGSKKIKQEIHLIRAPGRINLIGGHTDYNEGFVLPCTISKDVMIAAKRIEEPVVRINSSEFGEIKSFNLEDFKKTGDWMDYVKGVAHFTKEKGKEFYGFHAACTSTIPVGSGLSSSAAFEVGFAQTINSLFNLNLDKKDLAQIGYLSETKYMNISCGIMDQFISSLGKENHVMFLDCRPPHPHELIKVPLDEDTKLVIINSGKTHLVKSFINIRKEECQKGLIMLQKYLKDKKSLRDVTSKEFYKYKNRINPENIRNRVNHIVEENERVLLARDALKEQDLDKLGKLMYQSHESLDKYYDVSCEELNFILNFIKKEPQFLGARLTGAGKGGSVVSILKNKNLDYLIDVLNNQYHARFNLELVAYPSSIPNGAETIKKIRI